MQQALTVDWVPMSKYLITGVAGLIGSATAAALIAAGDKVRGVDVVELGCSGRLSGLEFWQGDICDAGFMASACEGIDYVIHLAAASDTHDIRHINRTNVDGTVEILVAAAEKRVRRVVFGSSAAVYGNSATLPKQEGMPPAPASPFAISKLAGEQYMKAFYLDRHLETVCLRFFEVYGASLSPVANAPVLNRLAQSIVRGESPTLECDGESSRDFTYIDDVVRAVRAACETPAERICGRAFNIASGRRTTMNQAIEMLAEITGFDGKPVLPPGDREEVRHSFGDISRAREAFGYVSRIPFQEGIAKLVESLSERASTREEAKVLD